MQYVRHLSRELESGPSRGKARLVSSARNLGDYGRFLELAAIESGRPIHLTRISQESGLSLSTIDTCRWK